MITDELEREEYIRALLLRAGMAFFVKNYFIFRNYRYKRPDNVTVERVSAASTIFAESFNIEALRLTAASKSPVSKVAVALYLLETGSYPDTDTLLVSKRRRSIRY